MPLTAEENKQFESLYAVLKEKKAKCELTHKAWHTACHELELIERQINPLWRKVWAIG